MKRKAHVDRLLKLQQTLEQNNFTIPRRNNHTNFNDCQISIVSKVLGYSHIGVH